MVVRRGMGEDCLVHLQEKMGKQAWSAALSRAKGEKILDDPKLLRKYVFPDINAHDANQDFKARRDCCHSTSETSCLCSGRI